MKQVTCAVLIVTPSDKILIVHPTGSSNDDQNWSLPKGKSEPNESHHDAAVRELKEETGIIIDSSELIDMGIYPYLPEKDYHLFAYESDYEINLKSLKCTSFCIDKDGKEIPEVDKFMMVKSQECIDMLNKKQSNIVYRLVYNVVK